MKLELKPVLTPSDIPSGIAVHGTTRAAWGAICKCSLCDLRPSFLIVCTAKEGLSKMKRNHVHLAQGVLGDGVISGKWDYFQTVINILFNSFIRRHAK